MSTEERAASIGELERTDTGSSWRGKTLGRFRLMSILGQGGMGRVFRAEDVSLKRQVALKVFPQKLTRGERTYRLEQFIREARSAATLEHPHVVHIYEVGQAGGWYYIAMELVEGGNLSELVRAGGPLDVPRACQLVAEAADAIAAAHRSAIVHRDIKPANLMLSRSGRCKVADFGLARVDDPNDPFNLPSEAVGTPLYSAPEVSLGQPATAASDIYSLGATLYYLLAGTAPFNGKSRKEVLRLHQSAPLPDLRDRRADVPESLMKAILTAMAKKPAERFRDADQFAKILRAHTIQVGSAAGLPGVAGGSTAIPVPPSSSGGLPALPPGGSSAASMTLDPRPHTLAWVGVGAGVLALALVVAFLLWRGGGGAPAVAAAHVDHGPTQGTAPPAITARATQAPTGATPGPTPSARPSPSSAQALPVAVPPGSVVRVADAQVLNALAAQKSAATVEGTVRSVEKSSTGKIVRIFFREVTDPDGFYVGYFDSLYAPMEARFGPGAKSLVGQRVQIKGQVQIYRDTPNIILKSPTDVTVQP